jgi:aspartate/methionine/tyrosine aminotransferase
MIKPQVFEVTSPFQRLRDLLGKTEPGLAPIDMTIGEPRHGVPPFALEIIRERQAEFAKYPPIQGTPQLRAAIAGWIERHSGLSTGSIDPAAGILPLNGTREGLVSALIIAVALKGIDRPAVLMPNPFYQAYVAAAAATGSEPVLLPAAGASGFLPNLDSLEPDLLQRTAAFYIASPANPQGSIATPEYLRRLIELAREHGFFLFSDECYSEIYRDTAPTSALAIAASTGKPDRVLVFNSLSKRSGAPGLRSGFIAGDPAFLAAYGKFRNVASPQVPLPIQHASAALWNDEAHVQASRDLYRAKVADAARQLGHFEGFSAPDGGFFLWLDFANYGGGEAAALRLWQRYGVKILPGGTLAQTDAQGLNPGAAYGRVALVDSLDVTSQGVSRIARFVAEH